MDGGTSTGAICESFAEKVTDRKTSVIGDGSSQEGGIWREDIPGRRKRRCRGSEVGAYLMYLSNNRVASVLGAE